MSYFNSGDELEHASADLRSNEAKLQERIEHLEARVAELESAIQQATEYGEVAFMGVNIPFKSFKILKQALQGDNDE